MNNTIIKNVIAFAAGVVAIAAVSIEANAQMLRLSVHTTSQSVAIVEKRGDYIPEPPEQIEVYMSDAVDEPPTFPGGYNALIHYINSSRHYPSQAYRRGVSGRVVCTFIVQPDGEITHINVWRSVEPSLDREALRVLNEMPRWHPGRMDGKAVPTLYILPVNFRL